MANKLQNRPQGILLHKNHQDEKECYRRLQKEQILKIRGLSVPHLERSNDELMVIEMTYVQPPYLLDFGKVYIDQPPPYCHDKRIMEEWNEKIRNEFGEHAPKVHAIMRELKRLGIYYVDPRPSNIRFE